MSEPVHTTSIIAQVVTSVGGLASVAIAWGILDRLMTARKGGQAEERAHELEVRKDRDDAYAARDAAFLARDAAYATIDRLRAMIEELHLEKSRVWAAARRLDNWAHNLRHQANNAIWAAFAAGKMIGEGRTTDLNGNPIERPPELPEVPPLESFLVDSPPKDKA